MKDLPPAQSDAEWVDIDAYQNLAEQLVDLQTQVAFQEQTIAELNEALASQQRELGAIQREWAAMKAMYESLQRQDSAQSAGDVLSERPPHY